MKAPTAIKIKEWNKPFTRLPQALSLLPHQEEAVRFALSRNRAYLSADPGLGKTIMAARIAEELFHEHPDARFVYVCPPYMVINVGVEFLKWAPYASSRTKIIPDSLLIREDTRPAMLEHVARHPSLLFIDEAHRYKNREAKRTRELIIGNGPGLPPWLDYFSRVVFLSGTPMPSRPMEMYSILSSSAPETIGYMNVFQFGRRYCAGFRTHFGWDFSGASNMAELAKRVLHPFGPFMLRQRKAILNLPKKTEEVFYIANDMSPALSDLDGAIRRKYKSGEDVIKAQLANAEGVEELHISKYRRLLGGEKVKAASDVINAFLEDTESLPGEGEKVIVFAYHKNVVEGLAQALKKWAPLVITGETNMCVRGQFVSQFQEDPKARVILGNYQAMGTGFTLTKASRVIFVEWSWVDGDNLQAADRSHRIGQDKEVLVQYLCFVGSVDQLVLDTVMKKRQDIEKFKGEEK